MEIKTTKEIQDELKDFFMNKDFVEKADYLDESKKKKWVAVNDIKNVIKNLELKRVTDDKNYISFPMENWIFFKTKFGLERKNEKEE